MSRFVFTSLPAFIGDILWATLIFWLIRINFTEKTIINSAFIAFSISFLTELSQLYHAPWIDAIRDTLLGGIILGFTFVYCDLFYYFVGVILGVTIDVIIFRKS